MPDEPVSLRDYMDNQFALRDRALAIQHTASAQALELATRTMERRLDALNELRSEVSTDRSQFVKVDVYAPAHEELRRQRNADNEKAIILTGQVQENSKDIASMKSSLTWLTRLIVGAILMSVIAYVFQRLTGR